MKEEHLKGGFGHWSHKSRDWSKFSTGFSDNLTPLESLDLSKVQSFEQLAKAMSNTAFGGRSLGEACDILYEMSSNPDCYVVGTFSGAMTVAKMGLLICDMIDRGMINAVVSTGALMAHGFVESVGMRHFKYNFSMNDTLLYEKGYDRVYDTLELEKNLDAISEIVEKVLDKVDSSETLCSYKITNLLGKYLHENVEGRGILKSAYAKNVPVYIPAFTDSVLAFDFEMYNRKQKSEGKSQLQFNPFLDFNHYVENVKNAKKLGIFTIGGGVPRNWAQQAGAFLEFINPKFGYGEGFKRIHYGVRICPEPVHWGGLSGCSYSEGISWGKFVPEKEGGKFAEVFSDATIAWPIILKAVTERLDKNKI